MTLSNQTSSTLGQAVAFEPECFQDIQQMLNRLQVPAAVYGVDGRCYAQPEGRFDACRDETRLATQAVCSAVAQGCPLTSPQLSQALGGAICPSGHGLVTVPIHRRGATHGYLICCEGRLTEMARDDFNLNTPQASSLQNRSDHHVTTRLLQSLLEKNEECLRKGRELEALASALAQSYEEAALLHDLKSRRQITMTPSAFLEELCCHLKDVVSVEHALILWCNPSGNSDETHTALAGDAALFDSWRRELFWQRTQQESLDPTGVILDSRQQGRMLFRWPQQFHSVGLASVRLNRQHLGVVAVVNKENEKPFEAADARILASVAGEVAVYLENFYLYTDMQELLIGSLRALTRSIDAKDSYTCGHSERVAFIAQRLARRLGLDEDYVNSIYLTGLLHDVGKIGVPEAVLCKPGRLENNEFEEIKRHPAIGAQILGGIRQMAGVIEGVFSHHERYDGGGYPNGRCGEQIPLAGRIVMLADAFDAMTSDRTYRKALSVQAAQEEICRCSGKQFDPRLAQAFLDLNVESLVDELDGLQQREPQAFRLGNVRGGAGSVIGQE